MKSFALGGLMTGLLSLPAFAADCTLPQAPTHLPNGATATREEMLSAIQAIRDYEAAVKAFSACANRSNDETLVQSAERAVDKVRLIADKFNFELQSFRRRSGT